ncbi:MAG: cation:proton antiporter [Actinomycetota bacterium]
MFFIYAAGALFLYALVSERLEPTPISGPMVFAAIGVIGHATGAIEPIRITESPIVALLEITLALLLFTDAMNVHIASWEADAKLPTRLLLIGMPLTIILGTGAAALIYPAVGVVAAATIATILAPTDAALGHAVVSNPRVPTRIREAIGVESGLNDGIALPILLFLIALGGTKEGEALWSLFVKGIGIALVVGLAVGFGAGVAIRLASKHGWISRSWTQIAVVALAFVTFLATDHLGGSGFIAAYVAGHAFGRIVGEIDEDSGVLGEYMGTGLAMVSFLIFGAYILGPHLGGLTGAHVLYAVASLTVVRMIPVWISMTRTGARPPTVAFLGWFGPRGLASIIFAGVLVEESGVAGSEVIITAVIATVTLSIIAHGATAPWAAERYASWVDSR